MTKKHALAILLFSGLLCLFVSPHTTSAAPDPALVPPPGTWQLDFSFFGSPEPIDITLPGSPTKRYWFMIYTITNRSYLPVEFYPRFELLTNTMQLYDAGLNARRPIFNAIANRYRAKYPLLEPESMITGRILQGDDNARDSVVIFADFDPNATSIDIFIAGLSNETTMVQLPGTEDLTTKKPKEVLLRKTLVLKWQVPGDPLRPEKRVMLYRGRKWIMR